MERINLDGHRISATAKFNGPVPRNPSPAMIAHIRKFGACLGQQKAFGTNKTVGRCAEFRAANTLTRFGAKIKDIRWTLAYFVEKGDNGFTERGDVALYCDVCTTLHDVEN